MITIASLAVLFIPPSTTSQMLVMNMLKLIHRPKLTSFCNTITGRAFSATAMTQNTPTTLQRDAKSADGQSTSSAFSIT